MWQKEAASEAASFEDDSAGDFGAPRHKKRTCELMAWSTRQSRSKQVLRHVGIVMEYGSGMDAADAARQGVSSVEVYGFVGWISTFVAYGERSWQGKCMIDTQGVE